MAAHPTQGLWCLWMVCDACGEHYEVLGDRAFIALTKRRHHRPVLCGSCDAQKLVRLDRAFERAS